MQNRAELIVATAIVLLLSAITLQSVSPDQNSSSAAAASPAEPVAVVVPAEPAAPITEAAVAETPVSAAPAAETAIPAQPAVAPTAAAPTAAAPTAAAPTVAAPTVAAEPVVTPAAVKAAPVVAPAPSHKPAAAKPVASTKPAVPDTVRTPAKMDDAALQAASNKTLATDTKPKKSAIEGQVTVSFTAPCWISIKDEKGLILAEGLYRSGQTIMTPANAKHTLTASNPKAVHVAGDTGPKIIADTAEHEGS